MKHKYKPKPNKMYWADKFANEIVKSGNHKPYWVDDMKTPSGRVHIGSIRAVVTHYLVYKTLIEKGVDATFSYVLEDHDPLDKLPKYLNEKEFGQHLGKPLFLVPSPEPGYKSYSHRWGKEYQEIFNSVGVNPKVIWGSQLYLSGKMNDMVKVCLDQADRIKEIYKTLYDQEKPSNWYPFNVACQKCGKLSTTTVSAWDGEKVTYECKTDAVNWTQGCGNQDKTSPFSNKDQYAGKLPWKVEWPCKWKIIGVTIEGAGKDHMTEGGSHDFAKLVCKNVINYPVPFHFSHEFFLVDGRKMSSSKGTGSSAKEISEIIPPYLIRFMITRVPFNRAINFDPRGDTIPDLFDAYDEAAQAYWSGKDKKLARIFELSQVEGKPPQKHFLPRFRDVAKYLQDPRVNLLDKFAQVKSSQLSDQEQQVLNERIKYAQVWLEGYAPEEQIFSLTSDIPEEVVNLSSDQKNYLSKISSLLQKDWNSPESFQQALYNQAKDINLSTRMAFEAIYLSLIGKNYGPKAAWFLLGQDKKIVTQRLQDAITYQPKEEKVEYQYQILKDPSLVRIDKSITSAYPSMKIAMAIIKGVDNRKAKSGFAEYQAKVIDEVKDITLDDINHSQEIISYRKAIKESGIDWHKRRPTMEALLRRVALGKELHWINPLVDIGNLMAMKHQASQGVFDIDKVKFPVVMKKSAGGEKVLMLGDKEEINLQKGEICYFDQEGPFIVDLCWRDAQRTGATEETKNIMFLSEAVYDITRGDLEEVLTDLINTVTKYVGGKVVKKGIITA